MIALSGWEPTAYKGKRRPKRCIACEMKTFANARAEENLDKSRAYTFSFRMVFVLVDVQYHCLHVGVSSSFGDILCGAWLFP